MTHQTVTIARGKITVRDALVVRADVLINGEQGRLGAVVDGIMLDLGRIEPNALEQLAAHTHIEVEAAHPGGGTVRRRVPIVHH